MEIPSNVEAPKLDGKGLFQSRKDLSGLLCPICFAPEVIDGKVLFLTSGERTIEEGILYVETYFGFGTFLDKPHALFPCKKVIESMVGNTLGIGGCLSLK
ncbi:hypothetical protein SLA2020_413690 [Shorea laevis]